MKKIFFTLILMVSFVSVLFAQANGKTLGIRLGYPSEFSFQTSLNNTNRLELGLGYRNYSYANSMSLSGVYQWVWDLSSLSEGFNWYAGVGAQAGFYSNSKKNYFPVSVLGQVGIQYDFKIPIRLSLDYRPAFLLTGIYAGENAFVGDGFCLGVRYRF
jgi:hypothetical protein